MKIAIVVNKLCGGLIGQDAEAIVGQLEEGLRGAGHEVTTTLTDGAGIAGAIDEKIAAGVDAVIIGGGDGTIAGAAQRLAGKKIALGVLPLGTMNLLAKDVGMPVNLPEAIAALATAQIKAIDVGTVNGYVFLCSSMMGVFPVLARRRERQRGHMGPISWLRMVGATFSALRKHRPLRLLLRSDKRSRRITTRALVVANNAYSGEGFGGTTLARPVLDGGELAVYVVKHHTFARMLGVVGRLLIGRWNSHPDLDTIRLRRLNVHSPRRRISVMNDGEVIVLETPLRYRMRPMALNVLVPAS